ncbi:uncharacterized protein KY384_000253 [Bacidia gigantensis]|uniref:uncharacterized protein n=1 Tax=Bacidia gigantensis TaxID=2732470 RepID=UPI001D04A75B|nr:uncharacterized protein KY384_000253 [Bacidia gigantensis]KAG8526260.1 hypothetical protein KY384_000253 [Bacidia gigantensis]
MARTKLVMKPPPLKDPSMLELYAHCVSATAMEDPQKRQRAFDRAAQSTREDDPCKEIGNPPSRSLEMAENDLNKPSSGGFVYICEQCIRRENKRIARKKLKNEQDEENWRTDQPKRIIVFNKAEVLEWKNVESYKDEETGERSTLVGQSKEELPNNTMQVHCPMRIQCYSRHHGEKVGYRVIFTVKDSDDKLIAQTLSSSVIITDDHKTPQATKIPGEFQSTSSFGSLGSSSAGFYQQLQGPSLDGRNSFSTPDLQSLNLSYRHQHSQSQSSFPSLGDSSLVNPEYPASTNCSRPASPTALPGPQHKRRKGSGNAISRPRPDLTMTKMSSERMKSPPAAGSVPIGLSRPPGSKFPQPLPSHHSSTHGLSTPPTSSHMQASPNLPWPATGNFFPRSQSVENLQSLQDVFSAPSSAWQSQVPSPESSPQSYSQVHVQAQGHRNPSNEPMPGRALPKLPIICKTTPADGPQSGGVEVTCLGEGFRSSSQIFFGDIPATTRSVWSESALVCVLPPAVHPGPVTVTVRQSADPRTPLSSQNPIHFTYVNTDEQDLLKHALHLVHQQFAGSPPPQASDIARGILTSFGVNNSRLGKGTQFPYSQNLQYAAAPYINSESRDVEDLVLKSLEIIDLDDKPNKVNLNFRGMNGQVMLHTSASLSFYRLLAGLLARGAHPDVRDNNGMTPMHIAALHGNLRMVHKLRSSGADPTIRSLNGMRPAEIAGTQEVRATLDDLNLDPSYKRIDRLMTPHLNRVSSNRSGSGILSNTGKVSEVCRGTPSTDDLGFSKARPAPRLQSPLESLGRNTNVVLKPTQEHDLSTDAAVLAASPALSAWRDQISTQIQQLQQSVQRALPLMPALTDYQTHPVMRRISNLVPQRGARVENPDNNTGKLKDGDYRWWELITGPSSPPSYEEIYPHQTRDQQQRNEKEIMALRAAGEAVLDKKCELLHDRPEISANEETFNIGREALTEAQQQQIRKAHAQKVKKLHKDRNLFFIWIPILFIIMLAVLKERMSSIWNSASQAYISLAS